MAETFDLENISEAYAHDQKNDAHLQQMTAVALLGAITLAIFLAEAVSDHLPLIQLVVVAAVFVSLAFVAGAFLLSAREGSAIALSIEDSGVRLTRRAGRVRHYPWSIVRRSFRVTDRHLWATFQANPESSHYVLHESPLRRTALTEKAFNGLIEAAKAHGLVVQSKPLHEGGTVFVHRFSAANGP
jgi:hypothetical protein